MKKHLFLYFSIFFLILSCSKEEEPTPPPPTPMFTLSLTSSEGGSVSTSGGTYEKGTKITVTATPDGEFIFDKWSDGNSDNPREITVTSNLNLSADFIKKMYSLTIILEGEGRVEEEKVVRNSANSNDYESQTTVRLTAISNEGWTFSKWSGDIDSTDNPIELIITEPKTITVTFEKPFVYSPGSYEQTIYPTSIQNHEWNSGWYQGDGSHGYGADLYELGGTSFVYPSPSITYFDWDFDGDIDVFTFVQHIRDESNNIIREKDLKPVILENNGLINGRIDWILREDISPNWPGLRGYRKISTADMDNDGDLDVVAFNAEDPMWWNGNITKGGIDLYRFNKEDGKFYYEQISPYGELAYYYFHAGTLGDVNNDGWIDIIGGGTGPRIILNNQGNFDWNTHYEVTKYNSTGWDLADIYSIDAIDINNDGLLDLLVGASKKPKMYWYFDFFERKDFGAPGEIFLNTGTYPYYNDEPDIILPVEYDYSNQSEQVWKNQTFGVHYDWSVIDFDNDGDLDIFSYLLQDGDTNVLIQYHENIGNSFLPKTSEVFEDGEQFLPGYSLGNLGSPAGSALIWIKSWDIDGDGEVEVLFEGTSPNGTTGLKKVNGKLKKQVIPNIYSVIDP